MAPETMRASGFSASRVAKASSGGGSVEEAVAFADAEGFVVLQGFQPFGDGGPRVGETVARGVGEFIHALAGRRYRGVAGTAAQVAGKRVVDAGWRGVGVVVVQGEHRHDEARRAEAALGAVAIDHRLLHRVQRAVRRLQVLDGEDLAAVEGRHEADAGVDGLVPDAVAVQASDHDGAGAAVAFGAAFLGAGLAFGQAQPVEHRHRRIDAPDFLQLVAQQESHAIAHGCGSPRGSAAAICGIGEGAYQQRHVIVLACIRQAKPQAGCGRGTAGLPGRRRLRGNRRPLRTPVRKRRAASRRRKAAARRSGRRNWSSWSRRVRGRRR